MPQDTAPARPAQPQRGGRWGVRAALIAIVVIAAVPRFTRLSFPSFWYDEVVSVRLARTPAPGAMITLLKEIDATRAPLHPLILQGWLRVFGPGEAASRSLSAVCGLLTVVVVFLIGTQVGGVETGLWAAFLTGLSPLLVEYSRETRMYALLVLLTSLGWWNLLRFREACTTGRMVGQALLIAAMIYCHPLSLVMVAAMAVGWAVDRRQRHLTLRGWLLIQIAAGLLIAPWVRHYFDHAPEFTTGRLPIRFLLGVPIGFTGGDSRSLVLFVGIIAVGLCPRELRGIVRHPRTPSAWPVVIWFAMPPALLYAASLVGPSIFGPSRYNVYVAPAYLILLARGLASLGRWVAGLVSLCLFGFLIVFGTDPLLEKMAIRADWQRAASSLNTFEPGVPVFVISPTPGRNFEVEVARYYLGDDRKVFAMPASVADVDRMIAHNPADKIVFAASLNDGKALGAIPFDLDRPRDSLQTSDYGGLRLYVLRTRQDAMGESTNNRLP